MQGKTPMVFVLGRRNPARGCIECTKIVPESQSIPKGRTAVYKPNIKYMYKTSRLRLA